MDNGTDGGHNHDHGGEPAAPGNCGHIEANGCQLAYWYTLHIDGRDLYNLVFGENR